MIIGRLVLICTALATAIASSAAAAAESPRCVYPDPHTLVGRDIHPETVAYRLFDTTTGPMRWLFVSWSNPHDDGMAFVLACDGHVVAKQRMGYVTDHGWGGAGHLGGGRSVDVTTSITTPMADGSNATITESESWLEFNGKTIAIVWTHVTFVTHIRDAPGATRDSYVTEYDYPPKDEIRVTGKRSKVEPGGTDDPHPIALPEEKYCYRPAWNRYVRC